VKRASERDYSLFHSLASPMSQKNVSHQQRKIITKRWLLLLFKGSEQQLRAANAYIYKKNTQDPAQGIILHAAGLSRLYTYHLWLVVPGLFLPASPQNIQKIFFRPDFVLIYVSVRFHARDRDACLFFYAHCNLIHTCSHSGVTRSWQTTR
jgi:hypothetical protein